MIIFVGGIDELKKQSISNTLYNERIKRNKEKKDHFTSLNVGKGEQNITSVTNTSQNKKQNNSTTTTTEYIPYEPNVIVPRKHNVNNNVEQSIPFIRNELIPIGRNRAMCNDT